ncbi:MAG: hypothetical protein WBG42_05195 [Cryomorphaceae bacterium]
MANSAKQQLVEFLMANAVEKVAELTEQAKSLKESRNTESKSTAGDKHAVGRAMAQTELDNLEKRIEELKKQANTIKNLPLDKREDVGRGSLVETTQGTFFLAVGFGRVEHEGKTFFIISPAAPIGQAILGKKQNDTFRFREQIITITCLS